MPPTGIRGDPELRSRVVAALRAGVKGLGKSAAEAALASVLGAKPSVPLRQLDDYLRQRAHAFTDPGVRPPQALVQLASVLADAGYRVTRAACARCGGTDARSLRHQRPDGRICDNCARRARVRACARCGRTAQITARGPEGGLCIRCYTADPARREPCSGCGQRRRVTRRLDNGAPVCPRCHQRPLRRCADCGANAPVQAITDAGPVCRTCYTAHQPQRVCGRCGRRRPIATRATATTPDLCTGCYRGAEGQCATCGRWRYGHHHNGVFCCASCLPRPSRPCTRCGRRRPVHADWPAGPVCGACYTHARNHPAPCGACGTTRVLTGTSSGGTPICGPCVGERDYACTGCGRPGYLYAHQHCRWCVLAERVGDLLAGPDGHLADQLVPLHDALTDTDRPESMLGWLRRNASARLLAELARRPEPLSHTLLDRLPPGPRLHYIRQVLILAGVLEARDDYLDRVGPWLRDLLAELPAHHRPILQPFAHWNVLHRARQRTRQAGPVSQAAGRHKRTLIRTAARFLAWLDDHQLTLGQLTQDQLDQWLTTTRSSHQLRPFIHWTNQRELTTNLQVPDRPRGDPSRFLTEDQRWAQLRECLNNTTIPLKVRVAGSLILLLGARISHVLELTTDDITTSSTGTVTLNLGTHPIQLPPRLATLVTQLASNPSTHSTLRTHHNRPALLFPGRPPTRPLNPAAFSKTLTRHGITTHTGRNAALIDLAGDLPSSVLADLLGLNPKTTARWSHATQHNWSSYLAARNRNTDPCK